MSILSHRSDLPGRNRAPLAIYALAAIAACAVLLPLDAGAQACAQATQNGCTELSASPPQDTTAIPPNIMLILDDSGSMLWNFMPDWKYLPGGTSDSALINSQNNGVYYNPAIKYSRPPKADGTPYPIQTNMSSVRIDGFGKISTESTNLYTYNGKDSSGNWTEWYDNNSGTPAGNKVPYNVTKSYSTQTGTTTKQFSQGKLNEPDCITLFNQYATDGKQPFDRTWTASNSNRNKPGICKFSYIEPTYSTASYQLFQFSTGPATGPHTVWYVSSAAKGCPAAEANCIIDTDTSGTAAPAGVQAGENIATWFAYYHTRFLMAKSGVMTAFDPLSPNYRLGYGSLNKTSDYVGVQRFGDGGTGTTKAALWTWLAGIGSNGSTPLRKALEAAGKYYETAAPWKTMEGDPNYVKGGTNSEELACRASYTILTTDGFWNGSAPGSAVNGAASSDGTEYTAPDGSKVKYKAEPPFSGGGVSGGASVADIAAYYWKTDLRTSTANLVPTTRNDPAFWQHMTTFTMGIGFDPVTQAQGAVINMPAVFKWAHDGGGTSSPYAIPGFTWPTPASGDIKNIADLAHAAVVGHGDFFSAKNPEEMAAGFARAIAQISERNVASPPSSSNASVAVLGALSFKKSYNTRNWEGTLEAVELKPDGRTGDMKWDITSKLDAMTYTSRKIFTPTFTGVTCSGSTSTGAVFDKGIQLTGTSGSLLDCAQRNGLASPAFDATNVNDTLQNRIDYILGDASFEGNPYRARSHRLGAILNSSPVYVSYPSASYRNIWPAGSAESIAEINGEGYGKYVMDNAEREGTIYVGANDGMLHAFSSPAPDCDFATDPTNPTCTYGDGGNERWAYVPRAVYANLGNLTDSRTFAFRPTADASPRTRDVYFGGKWRTILVSGVGLGGRGVYALDISDQENFAASDVLWEFNADSAVNSNCKSNSGSCQATDLGYTVPQPNIARLANGKWVVLVPNGYFPDCSMATVPTGEAETSVKERCKAIAAQAPSNYSALFVLDAQTGAMIAELKTPTNISGVKSYGLGSVVVGDYENNQIDDVAFAGDLMGNLWRFDLTDANPANWKVTLAFKGKDNAGIQGVQPITVMPRLFPDLRSSRFMIVFGTGKYLGPGDNDAGIPVQAIYGIQEQVDTNGNLVPATFAQLRQQTLTEAAGTGDFTGATLRKLTDNALASNHQGWYINLDIAAAKGERVVETPATIFPANTAIFRTLIPSTDNYCDPSTKGAVMSVSAANGGSNGGLSSLGGNDLVGARVSHAATGGTVPAMQSLGGGEIIIPVEIEVGGGVSTTPPPPLKVDSPMWRRRSWSNAETK